MKKITTLLAIILFLSNTTINLAQNIPTYGLVIDNILVDDLNCWDVKDVGVIFPVSDKWKNFDYIKLKLTVQYENSEGQIVDFKTQYYAHRGELYMDKAKVEDWFAGVTIAFWKVEINGKKTAAIEPEETIFHMWARDPEKNSSVIFRIEGLTQHGVDAYGRPNLSAPTIIYQTRSYPFVKRSKEACTVSGKTLDLKFESLGYRVDMFGIKGSPGTNTSNNSSTSSNVVTETPSSSNASASSTPTKDATGLPPLDKKKPGYYSVPDGDRLSEEGYKMKNKLEGEYRSYTQGKLEFVYIFKNGKKEGAASEYWPNGKVRKSGVYKDGKKDGEWKKFTEAGKSAGTDVYVDGVKQ